MKHLLLKNNRFYYRRKIPKSLQFLFGMQEFCATLETGNKREAAIIESKFSPIFDSVVFNARKRILDGIVNTKNENIGRYLSRELYAIIHPDRSNSELEAIFKFGKKAANLLTLREYIDEYLGYCENIKKIKANTYIMYDNTLHSFVEKIGVLYISEINMNVLNEFDVLIRKGNKASTIKQKYTLLITFFKYIQKNRPEVYGVGEILEHLGDLRANAPEVTVERQSFTDENIRELFGEKYAEICRKEEYYFIGLLSFCLGLRPMELIENIRIGDVKKGVADGEMFVYFDLVDRKNSLQQSSLKTTQSARKIPISCKLPFFLEFLDFYGRRKSASGVDALLFTRGLKAVKEKMHQVLKLSGVKGTGKVFYSLRGNYTQILRDSGLHPYVIDYLTGHKGTNITQTEYARDFNINRLYQEIKKCDRLFISLLVRLKTYHVYLAEKNGYDIDELHEAYEKFTVSLPKMNELLSEEKYEEYLDYNEQHNYVIEPEPEKTERSPVEKLIDSVID